MTLVDMLVGVRVHVCGCGGNGLGEERHSKHHQIQVSHQGLRESTGQLVK